MPIRVTSGLLIRLVFLGFFTWVLTAQDILRALEDESAADEDEDVHQKFYRVSHYSSVLASAPVLAEDIEGFPALTIGGVSGEDVTSVINQVIASVDAEPQPGWQAMRFMGRSLGAIGLLPGSLPVLTADISVPGLETDAGLGFSVIGTENSRDCSVSSNWLPPTARPSQTAPYFQLDACRDLAAAQCPDDHCLVRFAYGGDGNCMICGQLPLNSSNNDRSRQEQGNVGSKVHTLERAKVQSTFGGDVKIKSDGDTLSFGISASATGVPLLGHVFEFRSIYEQTASLTEVFLDSTIRGDFDSCSAEGLRKGFKAFSLQEGECNFYTYGAGSLRSPKMTYYAISQKQRLQIRQGVTVHGAVPSPQSELSGSSSFGKFVWRGQVYDTAEIKGLKSMEKRRGPSSSAKFSYRPMAHSKLCEKGAHLAIADDIREVSEGMILERGFITPLTRNLHLGSATALLLNHGKATGEVRYFARQLPSGLCYRLPRFRTRHQDREDEDEEGLASADDCFRDYHFMVVAYGCDLYYVPLGMGLASFRDYGGEHLEGSTQAVLLRKAHQTPLTSSVRAIVLGFTVGPGINVPNITKFGAAVGRIKRDAVKKRKAETTQSWIDEAERFKVVSRIQWSEFLAWLSYSTQRDWAESVRAEESFDLYAFATPVLFGFLLTVSLTVAKWVHAPELASLLGGGSAVISATVIWAIVWYYDLPFSQSFGGATGAILAIAFGVYRSFGAVKVSDGELLTAWVTLAFCSLKASSSDPLTSRILGYGLDVLLIITACVILPSGRRMATSAILVRATVAYLDSPFESDPYRGGHFTFFSSAASALNLEALAVTAPMTYRPTCRFSLGLTSLQSSLWLSFR